jgi:hypothetical protein
MATRHRTTSVIGAKLAELEAEVHNAEPGTLPVDSETVRLLELYLHWLPIAEQRQWFAEHGEALRCAVFG